MGTATILIAYQARLTALHASASQLRLGQIIALTVVSLSVLAILVLAFVSITRRALPLTSALVPLPLVIYSVRVHRKRNAALLQSLRLLNTYQRGIARLEDKWAGSGPNGEEFLRPGHAYDRDLNLFGEGSLFELVCTCRTEIGRRCLADALLHPPSLAETLRRQQAIKELTEMTELREQVALLGDFSFQESRWETIAKWLDSPVVGVKPALRAVAFLSSTFLALLLLFGAAAVVTWINLSPWIAVLLLWHGLLGMRYRAAILTALPTMRSVSSEITVLRQGLRLLRTQQFHSPLLQQMVQSVTENDPPARLHKLERFIGGFTERNKESFYAVSRALLFGTQLFWSIEKWKAVHAAPLRRWLQVWGEFEALVALSNYAYEHPQNAYPEFSQTETLYQGQELGHPLLPERIGVRNNVTLDKKRRFYVVSGSNMSGKSTLLRAIGLNAVLAYAGGPVCAKSLTVSRFSLCASINVQDSLLNGKSKFLAEIDRLAKALGLAREEGPTLFLIDEILSGTNSKDRRLAAEAILRELMEHGAIGALSTHDLSLTELPTLDDLLGMNVHMGPEDGSNPLNFDYRLKPGVTTESNALAIARLAGVII